jgi:hypothetical protein
MPQLNIEIAVADVGGAAAANRVTQALQAVEAQARKAGDAQEAAARQGQRAAEGAAGRHEALQRDAFGRFMKRSQDELQQTERVARRKADLSHETLNQVMADMQREGVEWDRRAAGRVQAAEQVAAKEVTALNSSRSAASLFTGSLTQVSAAFTGIGSAAAVLGLVADYWRAARQATIDAAREMTAYREQVLELAALKGQMGTTTGAVGAELTFRQQTLQTRPQAIAFQQRMLGVGAAAIDRPGAPKLISQEEFDKYKVLAGQLQAAEGGEAGGAGTLAGLIPMLRGRRTTAEDAIRLQSQLYKIAQPGGPEYSEIVRQFAQNAPMVTAGLLSPQESMGLHSAFSITNTTGFGSAVSQFMRATVGGLGRMRGVQVEGDSQKVGQYLTGLGATDQESGPQIGMRIAADLIKQEQVEEAKGRKFNPMDYLLHHGYGNMEDRDALMQFTGLVKSGQWQQTFVPLMERMPTMEEAVAPIEKFRRDPLGMARRVQLSAEAGQVFQGAGGAEYHQQLRQLAFNRMVQGGWAYGKLEDWTGGPIGQEQVETEIDRMMLEESNRVGAGVGMGDIRGPWNWFNEQSRARALRQAGRRITGAGGEMLPGMDAMVEAADRQLKAAEKLDAAADKLVNPKPGLVGQANNQNQRP